MTSDNISPRHLVDVKRIAFETRPINRLPATEPAIARTTAPASTVDRTAIAALVEKFLADRQPPPPHQTQTQPVPPVPLSQQSPSEPSSSRSQMTSQWTANQPASSPVPPAPVAQTNGHIYDFVCEDDVKRALKAHEKIYINSKTIITPAARDLGEERNVFARV